MTSKYMEWWSKQTELEGKWMKCDETQTSNKLLSSNLGMLFLSKYKGSEELNWGNFWNCLSAAFFQTLKNWKSTLIPSQVICKRGREMKNFVSVKSSSRSPLFVSSSKLDRTIVSVLNWLEIWGLRSRNIGNIEKKREKSIGSEMERFVREQEEVKLETRFVPDWLSINSCD